MLKIRLHFLSESNGDVDDGVNNNRT